MSFLKAVFILVVISCSLSLGLAHPESPGQTLLRQSKLAVTPPITNAVFPTLTQDDRKVQAEAAVAEGKRLEAQGNVESLRGARENYEKALALWRALNDRPGEAETLSYIAVIHYLLSEKQKSLELFQQELQIWQAAGNHQKEAAEALNNIGVVYAAMGLEGKALESYQQALPLRRAAGDRAGIANTLDNLGMFYLNAGELQKALDHFTEALAVFRELNERAGVANTLNNSGGVYMTWGDYRKALEYFGQALELRRALGHRREEAMALNNIGQIYYFQGDWQKALDYHRQALELRRTLGHKSGVAASINNIGFVYDTLGDKKRALEHYEQALELFRAATDRHGEAATLNNIGALYVYTLKEHQKGIEYYARSLELRKALRQPIEEATMLDNIGGVYRTQGDAQKALEYHRQALQIRRASGHRLGEAASLNSIGAALFEMGELQESLNYFNQALQLQRSMEANKFEPATLFGIARVERKRGNLSEALLRMEESLKLIESLRGKVASQDLRASFLAQKQDYYEFYIDLLMSLHQREPSKGHDVAALQASERARARSLLELLSEARIDVEQGIAPELKQRERATHSRIAWLQSRLIEAYSKANPDQSRISTLEGEMKKVDADRELVNMEIRQKHPRYADLKYPAPLTLKSLQSQLDEQTVLLEYALGQDASFLFAVTRNDFTVARLSSAAPITDQVNALRLTLTSPPQRSSFGKQVDQSRKLYQELIAPAGQLLTNKKKLIIVPSGILHYLPFEVLLSSGDQRSLAASSASRLPYLLRDYAISYVPSAGVLASLRREPDASPQARKTFLAFADPVYGGETEPSFVRTQLRGAFGDERSWKLGRLAESRREVERIASLYAKDDVSLMLGDQASEENVKTSGRFKDYRYIHFATHGLLNEERPTYSGLILSLYEAGAGGRGSAEVSPLAISKAASPGHTANGTTQGAKPEISVQPVASNRHTEDGLLQVYEVFNLKLNADLVVLSACETGLGKQVKGEGLIGLTHAFFYAGTPSVVVSLWKVQDRSTADLMVNLYQQLDRDQAKAEALRQAKLKLIQSQRYAHPYYWAPFVLVGEP